MSNLPTGDIIRTAITVAVVGGTALCATIITVIAVIKLSIAVWGLM